jgi:hypothetical protein
MAITKILKTSTREKKALTKLNSFAINFCIETFYTKTQPKMILSHRNQFRTQVMGNIKE